MRKNYIANDNLRKQIKTTQRNRSSVWKGTMPIRLLLWIAIPIVSVLISNSSSFKSGTEVATRYFLGVTLGLLFVGLPLLIFYIILYRVAFSDLMKKNEVLATLDDRIVNVYHDYTKNSSRIMSDSNSGRFFYMDETQIYMDEITKIEYSSYNQSVKIYAPIHYKLYSDYTIQQVKKEGVLSGNGIFRRYYEYYDNFELFLSEISQKSNVPVERIDGKVKKAKERALK